MYIHRRKEATTFLNSEYSIFRCTQGRPPKCAFTLIELLAVISIILVLSGMLVVLAGYVIRQQKISQCQTQLSTIETALEAYRADQGGYPPLDASAFNMQGGGREGYLTNYFPNGSRNAANTAAETILYIGDSNFIWGTSLSTNGWTNSQYIYRALCKGSKVYMTFSSNQMQIAHRNQTLDYVTYKSIPNVATNEGSLQLTGAWVILDPWGYPYGYNPNQPVANPGRFDIWSAGPDSLCSNTYYPNPMLIYTAPKDDDIGNWQK